MILPPDERMKLRLRWQKGDEIRWLSHLDLARSWARVFRRAGLPLKYSNGYNPQPKIAFSYALPVGTAGESEYMDVELEEYVKPEAVIAKLNVAAPKGMAVSAAVRLPDGVKTPSLMASIVAADYSLDLKDTDTRAVKSFLTGQGITDKQVVGDLNEPLLKTVSDKGGDIMVRLRTPIRFKPVKLIEEMMGAGIVGSWVRIDRTALWVIVDSLPVDPLTAVGKE